MVTHFYNILHRICDYKGNERGDKKAEMILEIRKQQNQDQETPKGPFGTATRGEISIQEPIGMKAPELRTAYIYIYIYIYFFFIYTY